MKITSHQETMTHASLHRRHFLQAHAIHLFNYPAEKYKGLLIFVVSHGPLALKKWHF